MPEGDTIYRTASRLRDVLKGQQIIAAEGRDPQLAAESLVGQASSSIESRGKHLLIHFGDGRTLHSHLGMTGSWHVYAPGEPWQKPQSQAAIRLQTEDVVCVCFSPKTLELLSSDSLRRHVHLNRLGPDLLGERPSDHELLRRFRIHNASPIGEALMNQTIVCGVGNVYKSEVLFVCRVNPFISVGGLTDDELLRVLRRARDLMRRNLEGYPRRTRFASDGRRQWVYGRRNDPCLVCGRRIQMRRQGDLGRSTYWCPTCQAEE